MGAQLVHDYIRSDVVFGTGEVSNMRRMDEEGTQNKVTQMFTEKDISVSILEFKDDVDYAAFLRGSEDKLQMDTCLTLFECEGDIRVK